MFLKVSKNSEVVDNLMKYLLYQLKIRNMTITKFRMLKLIFKIKMELSKDSELYCELPYYWYRFGPYSEVISDSFNFLKGACNQINNSVILNDAYLNDFNNLEFVSKFPEVSNITNNILQDREQFYTSLERDIYKDYAPFDILYPFKFDIYDIADKLRSPVQFNSDDYVKSIFKCEAKLPSDSYYNEYCDLFSKFTTNIDFINEENNFEDYWNILRNPIVELWKTFTKGVRVQFKDEFYSPKEKVWDLKFKNSLNELSVTINNTDKYVNFEKNPGDYTPVQKKMIDTTVGGYLRG